MVLILPFHEHGIPFHLIKLIWIFFFVEIFYFILSGFFLLQMNNIHFIYMLILFIHSSIYGYMRLFSTLAIMNVAAKWKLKYDTAKKIKKTMK